MKSLILVEQCVGNIVASWSSGSIISWFNFFNRPNLKKAFLISKKESEARRENVGAKCGDIGRDQPTSGFLAGPHFSSSRRNLLSYLF